MPSIIEKHRSFVNEQIEHNENQSERWLSRGDVSRARSYANRATAFRELLHDLEAAEHEGSPASRPLDSQANVDLVARLLPDEIRDLPDELLAQLSISESDRKDFLIVEIIETEGGVSSVDRLLIQIYKRTGEIEKRTRLVSRLYRMTNKGFVFPHPQRKGIYGIVPFPGQETAVHPSDEELLIDPDESTDA